MSRRQMTRDDWTNAALEALAEGGVSAVRVDVLARRLGMTRGSFYWHFADRDALVAAALEQWERDTTETIDEVGSIPDPAERLRALLSKALDGAALSRLEPALVAHASDPAVSSVVHRVTERRVSVLAEAYGQLGHPAPVARQEALVAYAAYMGWLHLRSAAPEVLPELSDPGEVGVAARKHLADRLIGDER
ncbi:TetR/AcrR family transcriptional regulator [Agromyces laixinhei]|uniref:TetR/AcrR family transcriptional regulator n=1 Tax=Agromyces laixinhei TaxID=2585717 RepID=UPI00111685D1|nr:TetR/AcrR family transcriptional regulator [Agromyces laixinhei]